MIDCGAQISIISLLMVKKLGITNIKATNGVVKGIGQTKMLGTVKDIPLCIHNKTDMIPIMVDFIVLQNNNLIILGLDFLEKYKCIINCNFKMLHIHGHKVPLMSNTLPMKKITKQPTKTIKQPIKNNTAKNNAVKNTNVKNNVVKK